MYAIFQTGGKQYRVSEGDVITVEKIAANEGDVVTFDQVLLLLMMQMLKLVLQLLRVLKSLQKLKNKIKLEKS